MNKRARAASGDDPPARFGCDAKTGVPSRDSSATSQVICAPTPCVEGEAGGDSGTERNEKGTGCVKTQAFSGTARHSEGGPVFGGQAPLSLIASGTQDGLMLVRRYLDAWRGGSFAAPVPGFDDVVAPLTDGDLAFV